MGTIEAEINKIEKESKLKLNFLIEGLLCEIKNLPENPNISNIKRLSYGGIMYTIKFSDLIGSNLSPSYYHYKPQYNAIVTFLRKNYEEKNNCSSTFKSLHEILKNGRMKLDHNEIMLINPEVIEKINNLINK